MGSAFDARDEVGHFRGAEVPGADFRVERGADLRVY